MSMLSSGLVESRCNDVVVYKRDLDIKTIHHGHNVGSTECYVPVGSTPLPIFKAFKLIY